MEIIKFIYEGEEVDFLPSGKDNVMVNATQMAKIFGKRVDVFLKSEHAKDFMKVLEFTPYGGNSEPLKREQIIQTKGQSGTFFNRVLALKFAAWLDTAFELWVFTTIDTIINQYYREQREAMTDKLRIRQQKEAKKQELLLKHPDFAEYFEFEDQEKEAHGKQIKAVRDQMKQLKLDFFTV